jgi:hypothetical protein
MSTDVYVRYPSTNTILTSESLATSYVLFQPATSSASEDHHQTPRRRSREPHRSQARLRRTTNNPAPRLGDGHANPDPKGTGASSGSPEGETTVILDRCYHSYGIIRRPITNHQNLISTYFHAFNMTDPIASPSL